MLRLLAAALLLQGAAAYRAKASALAELAGVGKVPGGGQCAPSCLTSSIAWAVKCMEAQCSGCDACGEEGLPDVDAAEAPERPEPCDFSCKTSHIAWAVKCKEAKCQTCHQCQSLPDSALVKMPERCPRSCHISQIAWAVKCKGAECAACDECQGQSEPALIEARSGECAPNCPTSQLAWATKCKSTKCSGCDECLGQIMPPVQPPTSKCVGSCYTSQVAWANKCLGTLCSACPECLPPVAPEPEPPVDPIGGEIPLPEGPPLGECLAFCPLSSLTWETKCSKDACRTCPECETLGLTPAPIPVLAREAPLA